jgi:hypothetical protein
MGSGKSLGVIFSLNQPEYESPVSVQRASELFEEDVASEKSSRKKLEI